MWRITWVRSMGPEYSNLEGKSWTDSLRLFTGRSTTLHDWNKNFVRIIHFCTHFIEPACRTDSTWSHKHTQISGCSIWQHTSMNWMLMFRFGLQPLFKGKTWRIGIFKTTFQGRALSTCCRGGCWNLQWTPPEGSKTSKLWENFKTLWCWGPKQSNEIFKPVLPRQKCVARCNVSWEPKVTYNATLFSWLSSPLYSPLPLNKGYKQLISEYVN